MTKRTIVSTVLMFWITSTALPAIAQGYGQPSGVGPQQPGYGQQGISQEHQFLLGEWSLQTSEGRTASIFKPDGTFMMMHFAPGQRNGQFAQGRYKVKTLGGGRIELSAEVQTQGQKPQRFTNILRITPDGRLYNEAAKAFAQRTGGYQGY